MKNNGFSSIQAMFIMITASLLAAGLSTGISLTQQYIEKSISIQKDRKQLLLEINRVINQLQSNPNPESDSAFDPVWKYVHEASSGYRYLKLIDISSRMNPESMQTAFFKKTDLNRILLPGISLELFKDIRKKTGFVMDIRSTYKNVLQKDALETYFTAFGFLNVNTDYEYSLREMFELLTSDSGAADVFHTFITHELKEKKLITEEELYTALGTYRQAVFPVISTLPKMNIHYVPGFILKQILMYPYGGKSIKGNKNIFTSLLHLRDTREITPEDLHTLVKTEGLQNRFFQYIGTKTWFWKVSAATKRTAAAAVIVCVPFKTQKKRKYLYRLYSLNVTE